MRAVASAYELCQKVDSMLQVVWFQDWALHAPFRSIFEETPLVAVREATMLDHILYDRARKKNFFLPALPQRMLFQRHIKEQDVTPLKKQSFDFEQWARGQNFRIVRHFNLRCCKSNIHSPSSVVKYWHKNKKTP
jgi:hypothetical protein